LRSRDAWFSLVRKEWRELVVSRAWWVLLCLIGPLVGMSFISAVRTYGEASGLNGTTEGVGEAFSPLIGVWAPTFSACELAAAFLLPFVVIRVFAGDRQSGALKLEMQHGMPTIARVAAKALVLFAGWIVASAPTMVALVLWKTYGGSVYPPELIAVAGGHLLNAGLTIALGAAAAAVSEHPSTAAILTLGATVGSWIVNFVAAVQGGWWERAAGYTPTAMVAEFQHGLVRLDVLVIAALLIGLGLGFAAIWLRLGTALRRRAHETIVLAVLTALALAVGARLRPSWDLSENRGNSFAPADEAALRTISQPLRIEAHLAPEDPRRFDLERQAMRKLRRIVPDLDVQYVSATSIGLFEQSNPHYGEIWYELGGRRVISRTTSAEGVIEAIYAVARLKPVSGLDEPEFRGHPLAVAPRFAAVVFYGVWPAVIAGAAILFRRRQR
jgi:ABC-type transport system involved in multi-copper enzyme maturation permease subunit